MDRILQPNEILEMPHVVDAISRGLIAVSGSRVKYFLCQEKSYDWSDPEEWVRCDVIAFLAIEKGYPANRMKTEVTVPRRTPHDLADVVVYRDDACRQPYLVVETKAERTNGSERRQAIEQLFGNCNSLRCEVGLYEQISESYFYDVANFAAGERIANRKGRRDAVPQQYGDIPQYTYISGSATDIQPIRASALATKIQRVHSSIWAGGKRDPLTAFDEWSKLLFAKVYDERNTPTNQPRQFQVGTSETTAAIATRIHILFELACRQDRTIFPERTRINLPDSKITSVVRLLEDMSFVRTDVDSIGRAFEQFFGAVFRGGLGQYFTMRQLARFTVGLLEVNRTNYVLDPTVGSGGFLLEVLLQTWHTIDAEFQGQVSQDIERTKYDFAFQHVFGVEIHDILARICKINLLLHHDGHTNIEANRSCLDAVFSNPRMGTLGRFSVVVGNPPFGDEVKRGDDDKLGTNNLDEFKLGAGKSSVESEQLIVERSIEFLEPDGRFGLVLPDGLLNNQGEISNAPATRRLLAMSGQIEAIVSLPDYAFRKSGAQNKTSILFFRKFTAHEKRVFNRVHERVCSANDDPGAAISETLIESGLDYTTFLAEANWVGYSSTGALTDRNDLYRPGALDGISLDQDGTILGEWRKFKTDQQSYEGLQTPDCMSLRFSDLWNMHDSHRLDPKYFLFKRESRKPLPAGWRRAAIGSLMTRRLEVMRPEQAPTDSVVVLTLGQNGEIRPRVAGKGNTPPEWLGSYFEDMPSVWYRSRTNDLIYSSIDLWKGCVSVVPVGFDNGLVTKEFPIYQISATGLHPDFLKCLLRSRYYQRAFRAITTGHSNRRRTQGVDFEALEIAYPSDVEEQLRLVAQIRGAREQVDHSTRLLQQELLRFSDIIDGRGDEELPSVEQNSIDSEE